VFQEIVNRAQRSVDNLVSKYVTRMIVAIPFLIAVGFGIAAATSKLVSAYGPETAYLILAIGFSIVGLLAAASIAASQSGEATAQSGAETGATDSSSQVSHSDAQSLPSKLDDLLPLLGTVGPLAFPIAARILFKNLPIILAVAALMYLLFSERTTESTSTAASPAPAE
jgi:hypothetical protein